MRTKPPLTLLTPVVLGVLQLACMATPATSPPTQDGAVTSPEEHLGRPVGIDFELADWEQISSYYARLAAESPNVQLERLGATQEGRDFLLLIISSEENLARLDEIRAYGRILSDPRGHSEEEQREAVEKGRVVLFVSPGMHSTETSPPQMALEFAHLLATSEEEPWRSAREEVVVGLFPCTNPDGLAHVVEWYREHVGTAYEGTALDRLYQHYAGHDNNRDWFMLSLAETRLVTEQLYSKWRPQVYWDVHEQGSSRERLFVPPFRDPLNPNIDPSVITGIDLLGTRALLDLNREGFTGISTGVSYDMWWNGGNRNVPTRHNIIGLLTEAAGVRIATPIFLRPDELSGPRGIGAYAPSNRFPNPWPGGWWRLRDVIDYELGFARSLLGSLAREPRLWRANSLALAHSALARGTGSGQRAWLIPPANPDLAAVRRLVQVLLWTGVEVHVAQDAFVADERGWPAGTIVIRRDQPYGNHVKDLFEIQRYPEGDPPYDVAGWTLPLLLGVHRVEVMGEFEVELEAVAAVDDALGAFSGDVRLSDAGTDWASALDSDTWSDVVRNLERGVPVTWIGAGERAGLLVPGEQSTDEEDQAVVLTSMPRIGLYTPWSGHMPEGWMRWMLDNYEVPYVSVRNEALRAGALNDWLDVLVLPGPSARQLDTGRNPGSAPDEITRGLDPEGAVAIEEFVRQGGKLIAAGSSSNWALELFRLPLTDVTRGEESGEFSCPGSVVRCVPEVGVHTAGLPPSVPVFFSRSSAWRELDEDEAEEAGLNHELEVEVLARYAPSRVLYSGWMSAPEVIEGRAAWVRADYGEGSLHLFGFRPQYRSWSQAAFHLMFRALFLG